MAVNGNDFLVYAGGVAIAGGRSDEIKASIEMIEKSSATSGAWRNYVPKRKEWGVTCAYLVLSGSALSISGGTAIRDLLQVGNTFTLVFRDRDAANDAGVTGSAILKTAKISAKRGSLIQGSFEFVGNGELSAYTPPSQGGGMLE